MATQIQMPNVRDVQVSNLQAIERPAEGNALSSFMQDILPAADKALQTYNKENADRLIALGRSDQMNDVQREVNWLDGKYYNQGKEYQKLVATQAQQLQQFNARIKEMADSGASSDEMYQVGKEYLTQYTDAIYNSDLDADFKEHLYKEGLKENAVYQKTIKDTQQRVAIDKAYQSTLTLQANYVNTLRTTELSGDELDVLTYAYVNRSVAAKMTADPNLTLEEATKSAQDEIASAFKFIGQQIDPTAQGADQVVNKLRGMVDHAYTKGYVDLDTLTSIRKIADDIHVGITNYNDTMADRQVTEYIASVEVGEIPLDSDDYNEQIHAIYSNPNLSEDKKTALTRQLTNSYVTQHNKVMNADIDINTIDQFPDMIDFIASTGKGEDTFVNLWTQKHLREANGDVLQGGMAMINHAFSGKTDVPELAKKGAEYASSQFTGFMGMTQAEAEKDPYYKNREQVFNTMAGMYRNYSQTNPARAAQLLAGVPEEYRGAVEQLWRNGGRMTDARELVRNPVNRQVRYENIDKATTALTTDTTKLDKWFSRGHGGGFWNSQKSAVKDSQLNAIIIAAKAGKFQLAPSTTTASPELLMANMEALGMLQKSPKGYASTVLTPNAANVVKGMKSDNGVPLSSDLLGIVVDNYRQEIAKSLKTRPEDIVVSSDEGGTGLYFQAYDKEGKLVNVSGVAGMQGAQITMNRLRNDMAKEYSNRGSKQLAATKTYSGGLVTGPSNTLYGENMRRYGGAMSGGRARPVTINSNGSLGTFPLKRIGGGTSTVRIPANMAGMFNGNIGLATQLVSNFNTFESFATQQSFVKGVGGASSGNVYGHGIRMDKHPKWKAKFDAVAGDPQGIMKVEADFFNEYFKGMGNRLAKVGVPVPTAAPYPPQYKQSVMLLADAWWHGGGGAADTITRAMNAPTYADGLRILKSMPIYSAGGDTQDKREKHQRNRFYRDALRQHFTAQGKR
ncbi:internal virion lysozyme motif [Acinetobacter phage vB_AbaP_Tama]